MSSLKGLYEQLNMIEQLGRSINMRTIIIGKTYAFASSFKNSIKNTMDKVV